MSRLHPEDFALLVGVLDWMAAERQGQNPSARYSYNHAKDVRGVFEKFLDENVPGRTTGRRDGDEEPDEALKALLVAGDMLAAVAVKLAESLGDAKTPEGRKRIEQLFAALGVGVGEWCDARKAVTL